VARGSAISGPRHSSITLVARSPKPLSSYIANNLFCACASGLGNSGPRHFSIKSCRFGLCLILVNSSALVLAARLRLPLHLSLLGRDHSRRARTDCNAKSAKLPAPNHTANHVWRQLLLRIQSNWEQSGKQLGDKEKWPPYKTAGKRWPGSSSSTASLHSGEYLHNLGIQLRKLQSQYALARMQHQIQRPGEFTQVISYRRAHAPANTIAIHGSAQDLAHGKPDTRARNALVLAVESGHVPGEMLPALFVYHLKVSMLQQSRFPGEALRHFVRSFFHGWSGRQNGHCG
jgi:hypothetical protein